MSSLFRSRTTAVATGAAILVGLGSVSAVAAGTIGSRGITDNSIRSVDIKNGEIKDADVSDWISGQLHKAGTAGDDGTDGTNGSDGTDGDDGAAGADGTNGSDGTNGTDGADATYTGPNWSIVDRNVIGYGESYLRAGPTAPPLGDGSLGIRTGAGTDKSAFGNQVDFAGVLVKDLTTLGFSVYTTGENSAKAPNNMPSIQFEIDPNLSTHGSNYTSMVFAPDNSAASQWTAIDAINNPGKFWGLTGAVGASTSCDINGARCTWDELQAVLNDGGDEATVTYSASISKGRDYAFSGAVDAFKINDEVYDFEPFGVK